MTHLIADLREVSSVPLGVTLDGDHPAAATTLLVDNCLDLDEGGGSLRLPTGDVVRYAPVDADGTTVELLDPLPVEVLDGQRLATDPEQSRARAIIDLDGEAEEADVTHAVRSLLPQGILDQPMTVTVSLDQGRPVVVGVVDETPTSHAELDTGEGAGSAGDTSYARLAVLDELVVAGMPLVGGQVDGDTESAPSWLGSKPDGAVVVRMFTQDSPVRPAGQTVGYGSCGMTLRAGRVYLIQVRGLARVEKAGGYALIALRTTTDGSTPTVSSPAVVDTRTPDATSAGLYRDFDLWTVVTPTVETEWQALITMFGGAGSDVMIANATVLAQDLGARGSLAGGAVTYSTGGWVPTGPPSPPPPTRREYTTIWQSSHLATYKGSGARRTDADGLGYQGYTREGAVNGIQHALAAFLAPAISGGGKGRTIVQELSGDVDVLEVWAQAYVRWTYESAGGIARFGYSTSGRTFPATFRGVAYKEQPVLRRKVSPWVRLPAGSMSSAHHLVSLTTGSTMQSHYVVVDWVKLSIKYRK